MAPQVGEGGVLTGTEAFGLRLGLRFGGANSRVGDPCDHRRQQAEKQQSLRYGHRPIVRDVGTAVDRVAPHTFPVTAARDEVLAALQRYAKGGTILVEGPAGSAVLDDIERVAPELFGAMIRVRACWPDREAPYAVARDLLRPLRASTDVPKAAERVLTALGVADGDAGVADLASVCAAASLVIELGSVTPLAVLVDDLQWADGASVEVLSHVARRSKDLGCCFVLSLTTRVGVGSPAVGLRAAADHLIVVEGDAEGPAADGLYRRLQDASPTARRVALALSFLDGRGGTGDIAAAVDVGTDHALEALRELELLGLVDQPLRLPEAVAKRLRQEGSVDALATVVRAARALAGRSENDTAASLLLGQPPLGEPWAAEALAAAAERSARANEHERAALLYARCLQEGHPERSRINVALAESRLVTGDISGAWTALEEARSKPDPAQWIAAGCALANAAVHAGYTTTAADVLRASTELAPDNEARLLVAGTTHALSSLVPLDVDLPELDVDRLEGRTRAERYALAIAAFLAAQQGAPLERAAALAAKAAGGGQLVGDHPGDPTPVYFAVDVLVDDEQFEPAITLLDGLIADAQQRGDTGSFHRHSAVRAYARTLMGDVRGAESDSRIALLADLSPIDRALGAGALIDALVLCDQLDEADKAAEHHVPHSGGAVTRGILLLAAAGIDLQRRRYQDALERCAEIQAIEAHEGRRGVPALWRSTASHAEYALGHTDRARALATDEVTIARGTGHRRGIVTGMLAAAAAAAPEDRLSLLADAMTVSARSPVVRARAALAYGAELRRRNRAVDARPLLHDATSAATACGATALAAAALAELRAAGGRPRRLHTSGTDALTAMERRVAREAQAGQSNAEIASALFISRKTVEMHLSRAYQKLSISSRRDLAAFDL